MDLIKVQWNPALRPPRYYGHFSLAACQKLPYIFLWRKKNRRWYGHPVNRANFIWPIGDRVNRVPLYVIAYKETCLDIGNRFKRKPFINFFNPLSPKGDQRQISPCNITASKNRVVMRIKDMITQDDPNCYFNKFSALLLQGCHQEAGAGDFPWLLREWPLATFIGKWKKNRTKRNP